MFYICFVSDQIAENLAACQTEKHIKIIIKKPLRFLQEIQGFISHEM